MKKMLKRFCVFACIALIGFSVVSCDAMGLGGGSATGGEDNGDIIDIYDQHFGWVSIESGYEIRLYFLDTAWYMQVFDADGYQDGYYNRSGNAGILYASIDRPYGGDVFAEFGTFELLNKDAMRVTLNEYARVPGSYIFYRAFYDEDDHASHNAPPAARNVPEAL